MSPAETAHAIALAYEPPPTGKSAYLIDEAKVASLLTALKQGMHREAACALAGVSTAALRVWLQRADTEELAYVKFAEAVAEAEAGVEHQQLSKVLNAKDWQSGSWYLERKHPDRWAKRESGGGQAITIIVGTPGGGELQAPVFVDVSAVVIPEVEPAHQPARLLMASDIDTT